MTIEQIVFYTFSVLTIFSGVMVITSKNSVRAVLYLIFAFFCMAGLWMLLESEFLAIVLVLVYVGAVMVLFLFVVMMLDIEAPKIKDPFVKYWPLGVVVASGMLWLMTKNIGKTHFGLTIFPVPPMKGADYSHVKALGSLLYSHYLLPFEVAGVILLVAMIAAIALAFRGPRARHGQNPGLQVKVQKKDRLTIVSMQSTGETE